jgi:hypothetical protein
MARNSSGTHSLPASTNPVVSGTTITPTWANGTLADVSAEITDSLSRSGKGGMTAPLRCADGTVSAPAHSYTSETGSGWFRNAAGELRLAILGTYRLAVTATTATVNAALTALGKITASAGLDVNGTLAVIDDGGTSKKVSINAPTGLAADYALDLPTALPGSTLPVTLTSAGVLATAQLVNAQQNFGTPSASTDVVIKSYLTETSDTPTSGTQVTITNLSVYKVAGVVTIHGNIAFGATTFAAATTFVTLSAGYRPTYACQVMCRLRKSGGATYGIAEVQVNTDGTITMITAKKTSVWDGSDLLPTGSGDILYLNVSFKSA